MCGYNTSNQENLNAISGNNLLLDIILHTKGIALKSMVIYGMSKNTKNSTPKEKTTISGNRLENYFCSPEGSKKRKSNSMEPSIKTSPPAKKADLEKMNPIDDNKPSETMQDKNTPTSNKVCKHLDNQLNKMEK